jgi:ketosteroid isomerase-like protein
MSQENVEAAERLTGAVSRGDVDELLSLCAEDVVWIAARSAVQGAYHGHDGLRAFCADNAENFDAFQVNSDEVRDLGDGRVLGLGTIHIRGRGGGVETDIPVAGILTFEDGKVTRWEDFRDPHLALKAAGLHPGESLVDP